MGISERHFHRGESIDETPDPKRIPSASNIMLEISMAGENGISARMISRSLCCNLDSVLGVMVLMREKPDIMATETLAEDPVDQHYVRVRAK